MICLLTTERERTQGKELNQDWIKRGFTASLREFRIKVGHLPKTKIYPRKKNESTSEQNIQVVPKSGIRSTI